MEHHIKQHRYARPGMSDASEGAAPQVTRDPAAARALVQEDVAAIVGTVNELKRLRGRCLLLTGGTGFIGTWLLETVAYLNDQWTEPCRVYVPTRNRDAFARKAPHLAERREFVFLPSDVRTFADPDEHCDYIIHAAASASPLEKARDPIDAGETIVEGTRRVLELARQQKVERCLLLSSGAVYGTQPPELERVPEDFRGGPDLDAALSTYAEGKRYAEVLAVAYQQQHGVPVTIARPFTAVGAYQDLDAGFAATDFVRDGLRGKPLTILGDGTTVRSYCAAAEYILALWGVLLRGRAGRAYNVGSDEPISILELARAVVQVLGKDLDIHVARQAMPGKFPQRYVPDITRLDRELGLRPRIGVREALQRYVAWAGKMASGATASGADEGQKS